MGPELMDLFRKQAQKFGAETLFKEVTEVDFSKRPFRVVADDAEYLAETIIISTGASAKLLNIPTETEFMGYGVSACATCDGFFFKNQHVVVVGGGDTAMEEALYLSNIASQVTVIHRRDKFRAEKMLANRLIDKSKNGNVIIEWEHVLEEVLGDEGGVTGIRIKHAHSGKVKELVLKGVFIAIGHEPNTQIFAGQLEMNNGYIIVKSGLDGQVTATSVPGVFAAGDVADHVYRQAVTSAGSGCMAALDAEAWLEEQE